MLNTILKGAGISIGKILIAIIIPGLLLASLYSAYIIVRCVLQPSLAPPYAVHVVPIKERVMATLKHVMPVGFIIFVVTGFIILGIATPSEAAATGALASFILAAVYKKLNWEMLKKTLASTIKVSVMIMIIIVGSTFFAQTLAITGVSRGLARFATGLALDPIFILIAMQVIILIMGMFLEVVSIMMVTLPIFMPIVTNLGLDPVWFAVIFMINVEVASISPPFGLTLYVMKGVSPPDTTTEDIYRGALPFIILDLIAIVLVISFPAIALWLPGIISK